MRSRYLLFVLFLTLFRISFAQRPIPGGWVEMTRDIYTTDVTKAASLKGKTFTLDMRGVGAEILLDPPGAFEVALLPEGKMQVTVVKPLALVDDDGVFPKFRPISYQIIGVESAFKDEAVEGNVSCVYRLVFKQTGANTLNLSSLPSTYKVTWESRGAPLGLRMEGYGLTAERAPGDGAASAVQLRIVNVARKLDVMTDWVAVPACVSTSEVAIAVPVAAAVTRAPAPAATPEPAAVVPVRSVAMDASQCLVTSLLSMTPCKSCGSVHVTLEMNVTNRCSRPVRCDGMQRSIVTQGLPDVTEESSIQMDGMQSQVVTLVSQATINPDTYTVKPPTGGSCRFTEMQ